ncbi:MAG: GIY-YIG nuclease family protein [Acidobacteriota bacterium]|nr:GIY-YIG nuclease family protein [Acidobacteriota bacterium]
MVKVGVTDSDVAARIAQLQTGNPYELRCLASFETPCALEVEHFVHRTHAAVEIAANQLKAATGATHGIEGVVRVKHVPATIRFSAQRAQAAFPTLASRCSIEDVHGRFIWRKVARRSRFVAENQRAKETAAIAEEVANAVLASSAQLQGWALRTQEAERVHDDFLRAMQIVNRLAADLADGTKGQDAI